MAGPVGSSVFHGRDGLAGIFSAAFAFLSSIKDLPPRGIADSFASTSDVTINIMAAAVVSFARNVPGPRPPKKDSEAAPPAPKTPERPAPLPVCRRTIAIIATAKIIWAVITTG